MERYRKKAGRESALKYLLGIARAVNPKNAIQSPLPPEAIAELREQHFDRLHEAERRRQLTPDEKRRKAYLGQDHTLVELFVSECCEIGDPNGVMAIPMSTFETRLMMFLDDEELRRNAMQRDELMATLREYIGSHHTVTKAGVHGLRAIFDRKPPATMHEPYQSSTPARSTDNELYGVDVNQERQRVRPGLQRGRWGETASAVDVHFYIENGLPIPPVRTRR